MGPRFRGDDMKFLSHHEYEEAVNTGNSTVWPKVPELSPDSLAQAGEGQINRSHE